MVKRISGVEVRPGARGDGSGGGVLIPPPALAVIFVFAAGVAFEPAGVAGVVDLAATIALPRAVGRLRVTDGGRVDGFGVLRGLGGFGLVVAAAGFGLFQAVKQLHALVAQLVAFGL